MLLFSDAEALSAFQARLRTATIGKPLHYTPQVGSTNDLARAYARDNGAEGAVFITDEQTAGRGRRGRGWNAPPGSSLLMSVVMRPVLAPDQGFLLTMLAGVALCEAVEAVAPVRAALKWPNDLLLPAPDGVLRKAAGILSEAIWARGTLDYVVIGMGINVNWSPSGTVDGRDLSHSATSISAAAGAPVRRVELLAALVEQLDRRYGALLSGDTAALFAAWRARLATLGQRVEVRLANGVCVGRAEAVEPSGALLVRDESGVLQRVTAGDVSA